MQDDSHSSTPGPSSASKPPSLPKGLRRGTKVGERPGFVTIIARSTVSNAAGVTGELEVPEQEYFSFEEAEKTKNDPHGSSEGRAMATVRTRKYLNKWRERWVTKHPYFDEENGQPPPHLAGLTRRKRRLKKSGERGPNQFGLSADEDGSPELQLGPDPMLENMSGDELPPPSHSPSQQGGPSSSRPPKKKRHIVIDVPEDDAAMMDKLAQLEAGQARLESQVRLLQLKQDAVHVGITRLLELLDPHLAHQPPHPQQHHIQHPPHAPPPMPPHPSHIPPPPPQAHLGTTPNP